jgi:hypothetical protein
MFVKIPQASMDRSVIDSDVKKYLLVPRWPKTKLQQYL